MEQASDHRRRWRQVVGADKGGREKKAFELDERAQAASAVRYTRTGSVMKEMMSTFGASC
jgi:hypothetical protein